ncbi:MAG: hypothetical protein JWR10_2741 [Rubritepida sp.]|nr:hypothetical protein [Rubritepida sp.]
MRSWTVHLPKLGIQRQAAVLVPEGFSLAALTVGPFWLLWHRNWLAGLGTLIVSLALGFVPGAYGLALFLAFTILLGFHGQDLRRWTLARHGMPVSHVVLGRDEDSALMRLVTVDPVLLPIFAARVGW